MIQTETEHFETATASHAGMKGKQNEDRFSVTHFWINRNKRKPSMLIVLCDGIGGHRAGEVAAEIGVRVITEVVADGDPNQPLRTLEEAVNQANQAIYAASTSDQGRLGMGTTCACAWIMDGRLFTVNLGDSRIYLLRDGHIVQLTTDHTWIQEALDAGILTDSAQSDHPNAHVIRRYLGSEKPPEPDFRLWFFEGEGDDEAFANQGLQLMVGDILLVCSDGLTDLVSDEDIQEVVLSLPLYQSPDRLISLANTRGGHDNTTVVLLRIPNGTRKLNVTGGKKRFLLGCLAALILLSALLAAAFFGLRWWRGMSDGADPRMASPTLVRELNDLTATQAENPTPEPTWTMTLERLEETPSSATRTPWPTNTTGP